jgi:hypothetical protein
MSVSSIINKATGQIYDNLIPQGGGIPLTKGQLISANALGKEVPVPVGINGTILMADSTQDDGLRWAVVPGAVPLAQGELLSADLAGDPTIVTAPNLPAQANWVLTADGTAGAGGTNMAWKPATGAGGIIDATAPLVDDAGVGTNTISINFTASVGEIPYGNGTAKTGALTVAPNPASSNQFLGTVAGVPTWKNVGGSSISGIAPIVEIVGAGDDSQIAIGFGNGVVGQIPYGNGTINTGTLTNAPTAGQILGVNAGVPAWIPAGGSGTITGTFPIVETAGAGNESVISINYTNAVKGEIPVGSGTANTGVFLPPPKDGSGVLVDGYTIQSLQSAPTGMVWVAPTSNGTQTISRSATATTTVSAPTSTQDTLILVAEEPNASWGLAPNPSDETTTPYSIEFLSVPLTYQVALPDPHLVYFVGEVVIINNRRCVQLSARVDYPPAPYTVIFGHFYMEGYGDDAYVYTFLEPSGSATSANKFQLSPIVGGKFDFFHTTQGDDIRVANIAVLNTEGDFATVVVQPLFDTVLSPDIRGLVNTDPAGGYGGAVVKLVYNGNIMGIFGIFNAYLDGGNTANPIKAWYSIALFDTTGGLFGNGAYLSPSSVVQNGYGVQISDNQAYPNNVPGVVNDAYWVGQKLYIAGNWVSLTIDSASAFPAPGGMTGFAVADFALAGNKWVNSPTSGTPITQGVCVRPSVSQAGSLLIAQTAPGNPPQFFNTSTNAFTVATGALPVSPNKVNYNSIVGGTVDIGFGALPYDFIFYQDIVNLQTDVIYFLNASGTVAQPLNPTPTQVAPDYIPKPAPGTVSNFGIQIGTVPFVGTVQVQIAGKDGLYLYDPTTAGANLVFTGTFFLNGAGYSNANFSTTGLVLGGRSQSYVAQKGLKGWIQVGFETTGLTYS